MLSRSNEQTGECNHPEPTLVCHELMYAKPLISTWSAMLNHVERQLHSSFKKHGTTQPTQTQRHICEGHPGHSQLAGLWTQTLLSLGEVFLNHAACELHRSACWNTYHDHSRSSSTSRLFHHVMPVLTTSSFADYVIYFSPTSLSVFAKTNFIHSVSRDIPLDLMRIWLVMDGDVLSSSSVSAAAATEKKRVNSDSSHPQSQQGYKLSEDLWYVRSYFHIPRKKKTLYSVFTKNTTTTEPLSAVTWNLFDSKYEHVIYIWK